MSEKHDVINQGDAKMIERIRLEPDDVAVEMIPVIRRLSKQYCKLNPDDLESAGMYALARTMIQLSNSSKIPTNIFGYLVTSIKREMLDEIRRIKRVNNSETSIKLRKIKNRYEEYSELESDIPYTDYELPVELSEFELRIVSEIRDGYTYVEIAERNSISTRTIQDTLESLRRRIKQ